jgi:hypothetical protein
MSDSKVSTPSNNLLLNPSINKQTETSLREKLNGFTASNTKFLKDDMDFARDYMVQYLLFFDRLIYNAASSPTTQNEMNDSSAGEICSMAEFFAPYIEASIYLTYNNTKLIEGGNKPKKQIGGVAVNAVVVLSSIALFMLNSGVGYFTGEAPLNQFYRTKFAEPAYEITHAKEVAQREFSHAVTDFNLQLEETYYTPNADGYNKFKDWSKSFVYKTVLNTDDLIEEYFKVLKSVNKIIETGAEPFQIEFDDMTLPKKPVNDLTIVQHTNLFEQIIAPVLVKHPDLAVAMKSKLFLTKDGSCNNFPLPEGKFSPMCFGSGFPSSFKEAQDQILMIEQAKVPPTFGAQIMGWFSKSPNSACPINIMIPKTVTLDGKDVNFVDTLTEYAGVLGVENITGKIDYINEEICKYRNPDIEDTEKGLIKAKIVEKWKAFKKPIRTALHPDSNRGNPAIKAEFSKQFSNVGIMFDIVEQNTDVLNKIDGGKRATRKRGKRNSKRAPRKNKSSRKKRRGKK